MSCCVSSDLVSMYIPKDFVLIHTEDASQNIHPWVYGDTVVFTVHADREHRAV